MPKPGANAISDQAIDWVVRLNSGDAGSADVEAFRQWRLQGIEHEAAALEAEAIWQGLSGIAQPLRQAQQARQARVTRRAVLGLAGVAVAGAALHGSGVLRRFGSDHVTNVGERREVALADGSRVMLNALSAISVQFDAAQRRVTLDEGQASFTVARDAARPFIVAAAGGTTRALGTVFDIDRRLEGVVVTVLEGSVAVTDRQQAPVELSANQQVRYDGSVGTLSPRRVDAQSATGWQRGRLIFEERRLDSVVAELGRYGSGLVIVASPELSALRVTGVFDLADPQAVLSSIGATLPVEITRLPYVTVLRSKIG